MTDWEGRPIPENETPDTDILVWEVSPHPDTKFDVLLERSWQQMLDYIKSELDGMIENQAEDELLEVPFIISFRLRKMSKSHYDEFKTN